MSDYVHMPEYIEIRFWCNVCECHRYVAIFAKLHDGAWKHDDKCPICYMEKTITFVIQNGKQSFIYD